MTTLSSKSKSAFLGLLALLLIPTAGQAAESTFFAEENLSFEIEADFAKLFEETTKARAAGAANSEESVKVPGTFRIQKGGSLHSLKIQLRTRGNSSFDDCTFKKLKVDFAELDSKGTPLEGLSSLRINTHCSEGSEDGYTPSENRIADERGPIREAAVYKMLEALDIPSYRSMLAKVKYKQHPASTTVSSAERAALFIESKKDLGKRFGAKVIEEFKVESEATPLIDKLDRQQVAIAELFQVLIGNWDRNIGVADVAGQRFKYEKERQYLWNYGVVSPASGNPFIVPYDFDISVMVTQRPSTYFGSLPLLKELSGCANSICEQIFSTFHEIKAFYPRDAMDGARSKYFLKRPSLERTVGELAIENQDKVYIQNRIAEFYDVIANRTSAPAISSKGARIFLDKDLTKICGLGLRIPVGYLVKVLETTEKGYRAQLVRQTSRPLYDRVNLKECSDGDVWLSSDTKISSDFPD